MEFEIFIKRDDGKYKQKFCGKKRNYPKYYEYLYKDETDSKISISVYGDKVLLQRDGEICLKQIFMEGKKSKFLYRNSSFETEMEIFTEKIDKIKYGLNIKYKLFNCGDEINNIEFSLKEKGEDNEI